jgi:hypothetical protein
VVGRGRHPLFDHLRRAVVAAPDPEGLTDIDSQPGGFVDLRLTIRSVERTANGEMVIEVYDLDRGKIVGIGAGLPAEMVAGNIDSRRLAHRICQGYRAAVAGRGKRPVDGDDG